MTTSKIRARQMKGLYRSLLILALAVGGSLQLVLSVLANPTPPNTAINNTATATYTDPNNPGTTINTTSNTVTVTVAEVAGVTAVPVSALDVSPGGGFLPGHVVEYVFAVKNTGNDPTRLHIPSTATITGSGTQGTILISTDNGTTYVPIPAGNLTPSVIAGGTVLVKVPVTIGATVSTGDVIRVTLGDTGGNDNSQATQNVDSSLDGVGANEIRTVDNTGTDNGDTLGNPVNNEREASAFQQIAIGAQQQAFAAVLKTRTGYSNSGTSALNDDLLTYRLGLRVDNARPTGSSGALAPAALAGTSISVDNATVTRVLVSDAIPAQTVLTGTPTAPGGWTVVYTASPVGTIATAATWFTNPTAIGGIANAKRIGFINDGPIAPSTTVIDNFIFQVQTTGVTGTTTIANIAQVFGTSDGGGTAIVYDESGDNNPTNYNDNGTPGSTTPTTGVADPNTDGTDSGNNNGGDTLNPGLNGGGEDNVYTLTEPGTILNGPNGQPGATGPTGGINDDFTNQSSNVDPDQAPGSTIDPGAVIFTNTISSPTTLTNVLLVPSDLTGTNTLPTNTTVTISFGGQSATYTYNGTDFVINAGSTPVTVPTLTANTPVNYTVEVDLPDSTPLSTDLATPRGDNPSYPVPVYAFQDANGNNTPDPATESTSNATIDRVYTGFLRLFKEARVLDRNGNEVQGFSTAPATANIVPGNIIEYRITYTNISLPPGSGSGSQTLSAANVVITEDGIAGSNNWAEDQNNDAVIDTQNVVGTTTRTNGTVTFAPTGDVRGTTAATDVTRYENNLGATTIVPAGTGTFTFQRQVSDNPPPPPGP
jgi:hypothetical protein